MTVMLHSEGERRKTAQVTTRRVLLDSFQHVGEAIGEMRNGRGRLWPGQCHLREQKMFVRVSCRQAVGSSDTGRVRAESPDTYADLKNTSED